MPLWIIPWLSSRKRFPSSKYAQLVELESVAKPSVMVALRQTIVATCKYFLTMATWVVWGPVWMIPLHCLTPKTLTLVQESGTYLLYRLSYSQFYVQKTPNSQLFVTVAAEVGRGPIWMTPWNWSTSTQFGTRICYTGQVIVNFVFKYRSFCYHGNRGPSERSCNDTIKLADPETSLWYKNVELSLMEIELCG